tara:strand:+ start:28591 stop:29418 length:828 start_codon:yes stop_codon:yes gene_type:complete
MALETIGADTAASEGTLITAHGTPGTDGSYVELTASSGQACERVAVVARPVSAGTETSVMTIATGAASSEVDIFSFAISHGSNEGNTQVAFEIPFTIASGTRISAKSRSSASVATAEVVLVINTDDSFGTGAATELIGESAAAMTVVDSGGSTNTKGAWAELSASTSHDYDQIILFVGWNENTTARVASWLIDIGTGAAASETVVVSNVMKSLSQNELPNLVFPIYVPITSGSRVAVRAQCDTADAADRLIDLAILGVNLTAPSGGGATQHSWTA